MQWNILDRCTTLMVRAVHCMNAEAFRRETPEKSLARMKGND